MKKNWIYYFSLMIILGIIFVAFYFQNLPVEIFTQKNGIKNLDLIGENSLMIKDGIVTQGEGTRKNPYLIKDLEIFPDSEHQGIVIQDINLFLKIINVNITGGFNGIIIKNSSNISLESINIKNSLKNGILLIGSNQIEINNVNIENVKGRGIFADPSQIPEKTFENSITGTEIKNSTETSILVFGNKTRIEDNKILNSKWRSIVITSPLSESIISNNYIENSYMEAIHLLGFKNNESVPEIGRNPESSKNIIIKNNEIFNTHEDGIEFQQGVTNSIISHNFIHDSPIAVSRNTGHMNAIEMWNGSNHNVIENNVISNMGGIQELLANGILLASSSNNVVKDNEITNVPGAGIMISWSKCCLLEMPVNNTIYNNTVIDSIKIDSLNRVDLTDLITKNKINFP